tara:strand:+ start:992 stop:1780 length:789 start_codon:yes stop_codon:yes gene_type:complete
LTLFGLTPFADLSVAQLIMLFAVFSGAFFVKGIFGYGAVPLLIVAGSFVVEPHHAVVLAELTNFMTHIQYMPEGIARGQRTLVIRLGIFLLPSIAVGVWVFAKLDGAALSMLAGAVILGSVFADWRGLLDPVAPWVRNNARVAAPVFGVIAGLISGIIGAGAVSFISLFVRMFAPDRHGFRATIILVTATILAWRTLALGIAGQVTLTIALEALLLLPGGAVAGLLGARVAKRLIDANFFSAYRILLMFGATLMFYRGAAAL